MPFYRARVGAVGLNRAQPSYRAGAVAAGSAFGTASRGDERSRALYIGVDGIGSDVPGASVLVEQTGPDSVVISEVVDGETVEQITLPIVTVPAPVVDAPATEVLAAPAERQLRGGLLGRVSRTVVERMSWLADGDGSYTLTPGANEVISISGNSSMAVVVAIPVPPG